MCQVDVISRSLPEIGLATRAQTAGPEAELLHRFLEGEFEKHRLKKLKTDIAVFIEPRIDSGYPDAVIVRYCVDPYKHWPSARSELSVRDLKVLSFLRVRGKSSSEDISLLLGYSQNAVKRSLAILEESGMAHQNSHHWRPSQSGDYFGIRGLKVIEAKMSNVQTAIRQALGNRRLSNESYVLLGSQRVTSATIELFRGCGIGLIAGKRFDTLVKPERSRLPNTVPLLQFNEWIGRCLNTGAIG